MLRGLFCRVKGNPASTHLYLTTGRDPIPSFVGRIIDHATQVPLEVEEWEVEIEPEAGESDLDAIHGNTGIRKALEVGPQNDLAWSVTSGRTGRLTVKSKPAEVIEP